MQYLRSQKLEVGKAWRVSDSKVGVVSEGGCGWWRWVWSVQVGVVMKVGMVIIMKVGVVSKDWCAQ